MRSVALAVAAILWPLALWADEPIAFDRFSPEVPEGRIIDWLAADLNGDRLEDIAALCVEGFRPSQRVTTAFFVQSPEGFKKAPDAILEAQPSWIAQDLGEIDGRVHHCALDAEGLLCRPWENGGLGQPFRLGPLESMAVVPEEGEVPFFDFLKSWLGESESEVALPTLDGFKVWRLVSDPTEGQPNGPPRLEAIGRLPLEPYAYLSSGIKAGGYRYNYMMSATYRYPRLYRGDLNGDGRVDLAAQWLEHLQGFYRNESGEFSKTPNEKIFIDLLTPIEKRRGGAKTQHTVRDINGDGIFDVVANKVSGGVREMKSVTQLHLADPQRPAGSRWSETPDQTLRYEGYAGQLSFVDWDGDGDTDLIVPNVEIGIWEMIRVLTAGSISVTYYLHKFAGGAFAKEGEELLEASLSIDLGRGALLDGLRPALGHDFNGDGKPDAVTADHEELTIHLSDAEGELDEEATIEIPVSPNFRFLDLNRDGKADVLGIYPQDRERERKLAILLSK